MKDISSHFHKAVVFWFCDCPCTCCGVSRQKNKESRIHLRSQDHQSAFLVWILNQACPDEDQDSEWHVWRRSLCCLFPPLQYSIIPFFLISANGSSGRRQVPHRAGINTAPTHNGNCFQAFQCFRRLIFYSVSSLLFSASVSLFFSNFRHFK